MKAKCCTNKKLTEEFVKLSKFLRIIGDDNRLRILCLLKDGELCVCEIYPNLDLAQNLVSSHLKVLLDFGLIKVRQEWKRNYYSINRPVFKKYNLSLTNFLKNYE
ncbi:transcriptional regulator [Candidatus Falkowbacteria bacterium CG10_big_fil_rev_8_21_14_0_10_37_14]|uniref:Transcriptional regulator n=1 Tax=Candidatus Falkowbacteria bacterium CG10_big_fil_rev_8_21_14_0_10_37_14 TaxID=1974561 RepID=A0A2M6WSH2_9BACT|nr:winged helix-turn-helix transcriptional regulator [Candidatus Falkowbacteria bacterium]PIT95712.1 MAG: transcriptional regulator [Candidatus Falkowbacteria bacterium CG10_big_fil_rev_8_21_14_0_10_37_14]